jgi:cell division septation protein DedD
MDLNALFMPYRQECTVKASSLISTVLLALSLAGAAQATTVAPAARNIAPATIELASCDANSPAPCGIGTPDAKPADADDTHAAPPADPKHRPIAEPASPIPEPQTFVMLMLGLVVLGFASRRSNSSEKFTD